MCAICIYTKQPIHSHSNPNFLWWLFKTQIDTQPKLFILIYLHHVSFGTLFILCQLKYILFCFHIHIHNIQFIGWYTYSDNNLYMCSTLNAYIYLIKHMQHVYHICIIQYMFIFFITNNACRSVRRFGTIGKGKLVRICIECIIIF